MLGYTACVSRLATAIYDINPECEDIVLSRDTGLLTFHGVDVSTILSRDFSGIDHHAMTIVPLSRLACFRKFPIDKILKKM